MKHWCWTLLLVAALSDAASPAVYAEDLHDVLTGYNLTAWSMANGLPAGGVRAIAQDAEGYLWLGTDAGLMRFDGVRFVPWSTSSSESAIAEPIRSLCVSRAGDLWV